MFGTLVFGDGPTIVRAMHGDSNETQEPHAEEQPGRGERADDPAATDDPHEPAVDALGESRLEVSRLKEALLRTAADFDNFRKRTRKELDDARRGGREDLLRSLLPVFDNLERAIQSALRASEVKGVADGLSMVQRQFVEALAREGITRVPTVGQPFDPGVHEAIQQVETAEHAPGTILAEVQSGYLQGERLLRAAMVVVAKPKVTDGGSEREAAS
jgi:molecular chaperone GrpE